MSEGGKEIQISSYKDKIIKTALPLLHLVDVIKPGVINWTLIDKEGTKVNSVHHLIIHLKKKLFVQPHHDNAKYCVAIARKIGAPVYALPEDISEVKIIIAVFNHKYIEPF